MAANPLLAAHREARKDDRALKLLFAQYLGSTAHPRGHVLSAYRDARRNIKRGASTVERIAVLAALGYQLRGIASEAMRKAIERGARSGAAQVVAYTADGARIMPTGATVNVDELTAAWMASYEAQSTQARYFLANGDIKAVIGDDSRMGLLSASAIMVVGARLLANGLHKSLQGTIGEPLGDDWGKQVLAVIDERTTDCCLTANGQIVPYDDDFETPGTPHFAERQFWVPFHDYCRSSVSLYRRGYDEGITQVLLKQSRDEKERRAVVAAERKAAKAAKEAAKKAKEAKRNGKK